MKIIFVTYSRSMFGANLCLITLIKDLRDRYGVEPLVILPEMQDGELEEVLKEEDIPYTNSYAKAWVVPEGQKLRLLRGLKYSYLSHKNAKELAKKLRGQGFDLVYTNNSTIQFGADLAGELKIPHIWQVREYAKLHYHDDFCYPKFVVARKFRKASKVVTVSKDLEHYAKNFFDKKIKSVVVYDGVDVDIQERIAFRDEVDICNFIYVGVLQDGKNQLELLKAGKKLVDENVLNFHIHLIGNGDEYEKVLRAFVKANKLDTFVTFHGFVNNAYQMLSEMDAGVICSKSEAFGRVTVEYMLASLPVIGAAGAGTSEIVEDGKTGFLYKSGDVDDLENYMKKIILDVELSKKLGQFGRERALDKFSFRTNTDKIYKVMEGI